MPAGDLGFHRRGECNLDLSFDVIPDHIKDCSLNGGAGLLQLAISLDPSGLQSLNSYFWKAGIFRQLFSLLISL